LSYETDPSGSRVLIVREGDSKYPGRVWIINRLARLPQLADRIIAANDQAKSNADGSVFIAPRGRLSPRLASETPDETLIPIDNVALELARQSDEPTPGATSVLYLTSDAGEGKTTVINRAAVEQAKRFKSRLANSLIVPIPLSGRAFLTFDDAVIAVLVNKLRFTYMYYEAFLQLVRLGAIVPAFDGYEEMLVEGTKNEAVSALGNLVQSLDSTGTVFIAARKAFFEYMSFRTQAKLLDAIGEKAATFARLELLRWSKDQFCEYGKLRGAISPVSVYETVENRLGIDHPILTRAVLIRRLFDVLSDGENVNTLVDKLGSSPADYFYTFVDAIVKREAAEKWLYRVSGDVLEPLLTHDEHHELLSMMAQEMWLTSTTSLRLDVVDLLVDIFAEARSKNPGVIRQVKERIKQHSLLVTDMARGQALAFDHSDFQNFYLGEAIGRMLSAGQKSDVQMLCSASLHDSATIEQVIQYLLRSCASIPSVINLLKDINQAETSFSYCKENCGSMLMRLAELDPKRADTLHFSGMFFSPEILSTRKLSRIFFEKCHFQPTSLSTTVFEDVAFFACEFERLEIDGSDRRLNGAVFENCKIDSILDLKSDEYYFDPSQIQEWMQGQGASLPASEKASKAPRIYDDDLKAIERVLRIFQRATFADEEIIRLRLGNSMANRFFETCLSELVQQGVIEETLWKGKGSQRRLRLIVPMSTVSAALEQASGSYQNFLHQIAAMK
jgi:hypothetical protein